MLMHDDLSTSSAPAEFFSSALPTCPSSTSGQHYLTIEELKLARNSCWLCGCNWQQDHASLDCPECDGYSLSRPCPSCDGQCKQVWKRNISGTHDHHRASWVGQCSMMTAPASAGTTTTTSTTNGNPDKLSQRIRVFQFDGLCDSTSTSTSTSTSAGTSTSTSAGTSTSASSNISTSRSIITTTSGCSGGRSCAAIGGLALAGAPIVGPTASSVCSSAPSSAVSSDCESDCHNSCDLLGSSGRLQQATKSQQQKPQQQPQKPKGQQQQHHLCPCN